MQRYVYDAHKEFVGIPPTSSQESILDATRFSSESQQPRLSFTPSSVALLLLLRPRLVITTDVTTVASPYVCVGGCPSGAIILPPSHSVAKLGRMKNMCTSFPFHNQRGALPTSVHHQQQQQWQRSLFTPSLPFPTSSLLVAAWYTLWTHPGLSYTGRNNTSLCVRKSSSLLLTSQASLPPSSYFTF